MAFQVKHGRDWVDYTPGTTILPSIDRVFHIRDLAADATANPYNSTAFRAPEGLTIIAATWGITAGSATISAGNLAAAVAFDDTAVYLAQGTDNSSYFRASPRVTAGALTNGNLFGYLVGIRARALRFTSINAALGTGTFDLRATITVG